MISHICLIGVLIGIAGGIGFYLFQREREGKLLFALAIICLIFYVVIQLLKGGGSVSL